VSTDIHPKPDKTKKPVRSKRKRKRRNWWNQYIVNHFRLFNKFYHF
jgi:hypothetical protein